MNGIRVIRTIAFDLTIGSEVVVDGKTHVIRSFDLERHTVSIEWTPDDVYLMTAPLNEINKHAKIIQLPIAKVVGTGAVTILNDKILTIGDIPHG